MTYVSKLTNYSGSRKRLYTSVILWCAIFFVLLFLRDYASVGINKYIFLGITCICALYMRTTDLIYLFCFLFPLYVGLPGNYMTLVLLLRLLCEVRRFKSTSLALTMAMSVLMLAQNVTTGKTGIVPMMFIPGLFVVLLLFTYKKNLNPVPMIIAYSAGVASLGFIMFVSTLKVYSLTELMSTAFRLGSASVDYVEGGVMNVSVDPNFYGTFVISAIALAFPLFMEPKTPKLIKALLVIFAFVQLVVVLAGLSRAFILVLLLWIGLALLTQKNVKSTVFAIITFGVVLIFLLIYMSDAIEYGLSRFQDEDMATGNGRLTLIRRFWNTWISQISYLFFGVGLFRCNVHCMPLQYFFGCGLIGFPLVTALVDSYRPSKPVKKGFTENIPFFVTFVMMCTVPAAGLINFMFPLILIGLCRQEKT